MPFLPQSQAYYIIEKRGYCELASLGMSAQEILIRQVLSYRGGRHVSLEESRVPLVGSVSFFASTGQLFVVGLGMSTDV